jgi:hypothetical protein
MPTPERKPTPKVNATEDYDLDPGLWAATNRRHACNRLPPGQP